MENYLKNLGKEERKKVKKKEGWRIFKFEGGERLNSLQQVIILAFIGQQEVLLQVDVVSSAIPLLLSRDMLKMAETVLDMKEDVAFMVGEVVELRRSRMGHYTIKLDESSETYPGQ